MGREAADQFDEIPGDISEPEDEHERHYCHRRLPRYERMPMFFSQAIFFSLMTLLLSGPLLMGGTRVWSQSIVLALGLVVAVFVAAKTIVEKKASSEFFAADVFVAGFVFYILFHYFKAPSEYVARLELMNVGLYATCFYAASRHLPSSKHALALAVWVVVIASAEAFYGIAQWYRGSPFVLFDVVRAAQYGGRAGGTYQCPNHFAGYLEMGLAIALPLVLFSKFNRVAKCFLAVAVLLMLWALGLSFSRGGWLATGGMIAVFIVLTVWRNKRIQWWLPAVVGVAVFMAGAAAYFASDKIRSRFDSITTGQDCRHLIYADAVKLVGSHMVLGTGPSTFQYMHPRVQIKPDASRSVSNLRATYTHCDYLNLLCDYGLVGGALAGGFLIGLVSALHRQRSRIERRNDVALWAGSCLVLAVILLHSVVDFNLHIPSNALTFFVLVGLPFAIRTHLPDGCEVSSILKNIFRLALLVLVLGFAWLVLRTGVGEYYFNQALVGANNLPEQTLLRLCRDSLRWDSGQYAAAELMGDVLRVKANREQDVEKKAEVAQAALGWYDLARKNNPWHAPVFIKSAWVMNRMKRHTEAYLFLLQAIRMEPFNPYFHEALAQHFGMAGQIAKAKERYQYILSFAGASFFRDKENPHTRSLDALRKIDDMGAEKPILQPVLQPGAD